MYAVQNIQVRNRLRRLELTFTRYCRFAVTPTTEDSGLVEWVHHLQPLRVACQESLIAEGLYQNRITNNVIKKMYEEFQARVCRMSHSSCVVARRTSGLPRPATCLLRPS